MSESLDVIRLDDVAVRYRVPKERMFSFKEYAIRWMQGGVRYEEFMALSDVNLTVRQGETFGLVGRNGAGKSTLLKLVAKVLLPTHGRVRVRGRVAPLLEVGAGFHYDLTGRENIFLNGTLLGYSNKQIEANFQRIVEFSELGDFINAPLRTYSSGMVARLGFSVATDVQPEILIVDEILGVGDEAFLKKCSERITRFRENGTTILVVSHNMATIQDLCTRAALLEHGKVVLVGDVEDVIQKYRSKA